jgi:cell division protein FtsQ
MAKISYRNELIKKRRRKRALRKAFIFFILLICISVTLCLKLAYFNVKDIVVFNNKNVTKEEVIKLSKIKTGNNIFYQNFRGAKKLVMANPYISDVSFSRALPNKVEILVEERKAEFYCQGDPQIALIDKSGMVLEFVSGLDNRKLIKLDGIKFGDLKLGTQIGSDEDKKIVAIKTIADLNSRKKDKVPDITSVDLSDIKNIKILYGNMSVILGNGNDLEEKLNKALNILQSDKVKAAKGYIDVSYNGIPVVSIQR